MMPGADKGSADRPTRGQTPILPLADKCPQGTDRGQTPILPLADKCPQETDRGQTPGLFSLICTTMTRFHLSVKYMKIRVMTFSLPFIFRASA